MLFYLVRGVIMFELVLPFLFIVTSSTSNENLLKPLNLLPDIRARLEPLNLTKTYFPTLENYQVDAVPVTEERYPWIARVIHSRTTDYPHVCTASCIDEAIFITSARCIYTLKVNYTTVHYMSKRLNALAFVVPSKPTKQYFDDIGFIVVDNKSFRGMWVITEVFDANRTDNSFKWFEDLDLTYGPIDYKVVGYAMKKGIHRIKIPERHYNLTELKVVGDLDLCSKILTVNMTGYKVPCYHSCTFEVFEKDKKQCTSYHGVEGGAVFNNNDKKLIGVATWGAYFGKYELPVGFTVPNSDNYFKDLRCAKRIRDDNGLLITKGYYQSLCDGP